MEYPVWDFGHVHDLHAEIGRWGCIPLSEWQPVPCRIVGLLWMLVSLTSLSSNDDDVDDDDDNDRDRDKDAFVLAIIPTPMTAPAPAPTIASAVIPPNNAISVTVAPAASTAPKTANGITTVMATPANATADMTEHVWIWEGKTKTNKQTNKITHNHIRVRTLVPVPEGFHNRTTIGLTQKNTVQFVPAIPPALMVGGNLGSNLHEWRNCSCCCCCCTVVFPSLYWCISSSLSLDGTGLFIHPSDDPASVVHNFPFPSTASNRWCCFDRNWTPHSADSSISQ
jgi:hypothetical protein